MNNGLVEDQLVIFFKLGLTLLLFCHTLHANLLARPSMKGVHIENYVGKDLIWSYKAESHLIQIVAMAVYKLYNYVNLVQLVKSGNMQEITKLKVK